MRTTIDIPDDLFRRAKATAALRGIKLKELVAGCLEEGLGQPTSGAGSPRDVRRSSPPLIPEAMTGNRIRALSREEILAIDMEEDIERYSRTS